MRIVRAALFLFASASIAPAAFASGAYAVSSASTADACAHACDADSLCMAWTLGASQCQLWANAPASRAPLFGLSSRAPAFARMQQPAAEERQPDPKANAPAGAAVSGADELLGGPSEASEIRPRFGNQN